MTVYFADGTSIASGDIGGGIVLQVQSVKGPTSTTYTSGTTNWVDVLSLNITPSATSSRVKVEVCGEPRIGGYHTHGVAARVIRGSTVIYPDMSNSNVSANDAYSSIADNGDNYNTLNGVITVDSPSTTSQITYKYQIRRTQGNDNQHCKAGTMALTLTELGPNP